MFFYYSISAHRGKQAGTRMLAHQACGGMRQATLRRNEEKTFADFLGRTDLLYPVVRQDIGQTGCSGSEYAGSTFAERLHQGTVIEFADNPHPHALPVQPARQGAVQRTVLAGQQ